LAGSGTSTLAMFNAGIETFQARFNAGDFAALGALLSDDFEQDFPKGFPQRSVRGRDNWVSFFEEYRRDLSTWEIKVLASYEAPAGQVIAEIEYIGVGRSSGLRTTFKTWDLIRFDQQGRVERVHQLSDRAEAERLAVEMAAR
jgi:ketosteroid isomerase-like protein